MQIVILAAMAATLIALEARSFSLHPGLLAAAGAVYLGVTAALSHRGTSLALRALHRGGGPDPAAFRRHELLAHLTRGWMIAGTVGLVALGYGCWVMDDLGLAQIPLVGKLAVIVPFVAAVLLNWTLEYPLHKVTRRRLAEAAVSRGWASVPVWTRRDYIAYNVRHHLLFIAVPVGLIVFLWDLLTTFVPRLIPHELQDAVLLGGMVVSAGGVFLIAPQLIVRIWRTERLPDGPLRRELEALCKDLRVRYREMLIWRSGGVIANAGVVGLLPRGRYILLSDALLENLPRPHIRAIFAHEVGHIIHHHIFYAVLYLVSTVVICTVVGFEIAMALDWGDWWANALGAGLLVAAMGMGFGWLSRRFERQSDITGAWLAGSAHLSGDDGERLTPEGSAIFAQALEAVAQLNGISMTKRNWRHGSMSWRINHILWLGSSGGSRCEIMQLVRRIKIVLWIFFAIAMALTQVEGLWS